VFITLASLHEGMVPTVFLIRAGLADARSMARGSRWAAVRGHGAGAGDAAEVAGLVHRDEHAKIVEGHVKLSLWYF